MLNSPLVFRGGQPVSAAGKKKGRFFLGGVCPCIPKKGSRGEGGEKEGPISPGSQKGKGKTAQDRGLATLPKSDLTKKVVIPKKAPQPLPRRKGSLVPKKERENRYTEKSYYSDFFRGRKDNFRISCRQRVVLSREKDTHPVDRGRPIGQGWGCGWVVGQQGRPREEWVGSSKVGGVERLSPGNSCSPEDGKM